MLFKRPGIHPGNNIDTHSVRTIAAPCSLGLCLCSLPPWGHSLNCSLKASVVILPFHMAPSRPIPQWVPFSLRVKFWFLKSPTSVLRTCSYASVRHPLPLLFPHYPATLVPPAARTQPGTLFLQFCSCLLITEGFLTLQRKRTASFLCLALHLQETDNLP